MGTRLIDDNRQEPTYSSLLNSNQPRSQRHNVFYVKGLHRQLWPWFLPHSGAPVIG